jgi:serine/threonine protein kinase/tetratricopeptide (TPR) repeat protein
MNNQLSDNTTLSHYCIVSKIGSGGMGEVYLAEDIALDRQVALKVLHADVANDEDRVRRFIQEAKAASALNHPNILTVYEIGTAENLRFIATELVKGQTLHARLRGQPLTLRETLDVALQVSAALTAAHGARIVHRDIKPDNIMLRDDGLVKVLDFGLAKLIKAQVTVTEADEEAQTRMKQQTRPGVVMGTVYYMSPEQARGKQVDARSDIWSLGVVLYEMLTGQTPFAAETSNDSIASILTKEPAPLAGDTPSELQRIIRKSLQKNTDERYQTVKDLQLDLKNLKRELEFSEELERSQIPQSLKTSNVGTGQLGENATAVQTKPVLTQVSLSPQRSSAEYLVGEIKSHRLAVGAVVLVLLIGLLGGGYWFWNRDVSASNQINSIAVLPFENRSGNPDSEYLSDGLTESLIYRLSQLPNLKVSPTSSVLRYKEKEIDVQKIAADLGVNAVMSGRLVQRGDNLTISVELIDARKNQLLWGEQFERKTSELLTTQREIATVISQKLQLKISGEESKGLSKKYTNDNEAYQLYLKGRFYWNKRTSENLDKAIEQFKAAANRDPGFALAYAGLADCYAISSTYARKNLTDSLPLARANALRSIELDSSLAEPHATLGMVNQFEWKMNEAEAEFKRAIEQNPNYATAHHWYSRFLWGLGRMDEAWAEINRAHNLDPLSMVIINNIAEQHIARGDFKSAVDECHRMLELENNFWAAHQTLAIALAKQDRFQESLAAVQKAVDVSNRSNASLALLGHVYGRLGRRSDADAAIKELQERYSKREASGRDVAVVYSGLGDKDQAFAWLEKAFADRSNFMAVLRLEPLLDSLETDPRWNELLKRVGV